MATPSQYRVSTDPKTTSERIDRAFLSDEGAHVDFLRAQLEADQDLFCDVTEEAIGLVRRVRERARDVSAMEAFMRQYDLSSEEGVILMCLAEALLRIPDNDTAEKLISDKLSDAHWEAYLGKSESIFVNASTWGLMLTGKVIRLGQDKKTDLSGVMGRLISRSGEPMIRVAIRQAMKIMGHQYVMGETIGEALERSKKKDNLRFRYSFDMLGEAALTAHDAERYRQAYRQAIEYLAKHQGSETDLVSIESVPSISVKLSALHPRYHPDQTERVIDELVPVVVELAGLAQSHRVALTLDAEEADRLQLSLAVFAKVLAHPTLAGWDGLGLALQAYQKRAWYVIDHLGELARQTGHRIPIRLVKGAYWDTEIKYAQIEGLAGYPVFTRKASTDLSYLVCAKKLLADPGAFYPQFATHNAHTICAIRAFAGENQQYEYQRLHGMGVELYDEVLSDDKFVNACRVYAPVGAHKDLLPYLVRRLLENGANTSFVNRIVDESISPEKVVTDPLDELNGMSVVAHPKIPLPIHLYGASRQNSVGVNLASLEDKQAVFAGYEATHTKTWSGGYRGACSIKSLSSSSVYSPFDTNQLVGSVDWVSPKCVPEVISAALAAQPAWDAVGISERAAVLDRMAEIMQAEHAELMALCSREAGKSVRDGVAEIREAIDFCRYYAAQARAGLAEPITLPGPTGELNQLVYRGRGLFVCISPWNFPLAIFVGQVAAALVAGNAVIAKPAVQTSLMGTRAVELFHQAGVPKAILHGLPGGGDIGGALTSQCKVAGVAFTGSTETARSIAQSLLDRDAPLATLIAETGGQNAMIVDSSALPEQVIKDVLASAFLSAGQRCSALRVLCLQEDIADGMIEMLKGAMAELHLGRPNLLSSDVGPIIDAQQLEMLEKYSETLKQSASLIAETPMPADLPPGHWFAPKAFLIDSIDQLEREVFGPILHVVRFQAKSIDALIDQINGTGYGLTLGIHSRIDRVQAHIASRAHVGNCYVNRNMTGAVVGVQPFGGEGLSGTGPKAGGPNYLYRFCNERVRTTNTAAVGGNASLLALSD